MGERADLPIPDFDQLPDSSLAHRIRTLSEPDLRRLLDYEQEHGDRLAVRLVLERRIAALRSGTATPSPGAADAPQPERAPAPDAGSTGSPGSTPDTNQPLRHGRADQTPNRQIRAR